LGIIFKYTIQRPELLNRIGDNFVVFDFIRGNAASEILDLKIRSVIRNIAHEKGVELEVLEDYRGFLLNKALADLSNGGRGISNLVETYLVNPLSRILIKDSFNEGDRITICREEEGRELPVYEISHPNDIFR